MKTSIIDVLVNGRKEARLFCHGSQSAPICVFLVYLTAEYKHFAGNGTTLSKEIRGYLIEKHGVDAKLTFKRAVPSKEEILQKELVAKFRAGK